MNKKIWLTALLVLAIVIAACGKTEAPAVEESDAALSKPAVSETVIPESAPIAPKTLEALAAVGTVKPTAGLASCSWVADGLTFWVAEMKNAYLVDARSLEQIAAYEGSETDVIYDLSPDGKTMAFSLDGLAVSLFDVPAMRELRVIVPDFTVSGAFFSPDATRLGVASLDDIEIAVYDTASGEQVNTLRGFETAAPVYSALYAADGLHLVWLSRGTVQSMDIPGDKMLPILQHEDFVSALATSPDGTLIATAAAGTVEEEFLPLITVWDMQTGEKIWQKSNTEYVNTLAFSPDGKLLAAGAGNTVVFFSAGKGEKLFSLPTNGEDLTSLAFSPDGQILLTCGIEGTVTLWQAP